MALLTYCRLIPLNNKSTILKDQNWLFEQVLLDNQKVIRDLYDQNLVEITSWFMKNHGCSKDDAVEVYHKAFIILYENIIEKKLTQLTSSLKGYLYAVSKNVYRERFKYSRFYNESFDNEEIIKEVDLSIEENYEADHQKSVIRRVIEKMGDPCKTIIQLAFFRNYSNEAIADHLNYKDERVARTGKARCLARMRKMFSESNPVN